MCLSSQSWKVLRRLPLPADDVLCVHRESLDAVQSSTMKVLCGSLDLTLQWVEAHLTANRFSAKCGAEVVWLAVKGHNITSMAWKNKLQNFANIFVRLCLCGSENDEVQEALDFCMIAESEKRSRWTAKYPVLSESSSHKWLMKPMRRTWCLPVALQ